MDDTHTDNVTENTPHKSPRGEASIEACRYAPALIVAEPHLLLERTERQAERLRPQQVQHVSEPAEPPDVPLVPAHAHGVDLPVDEYTFLVVQRQAIQLGVRRQPSYQPLVPIPLQVVIVIVDLNDVGTAEIRGSDYGGLAVLQDGRRCPVMVVITARHGQERDGGLVVGVVDGIQDDDVGRKTTGGKGRVRGSGTLNL